MNLVADNKWLVSGKGIVCVGFVIRDAFYIL